MNNEIISYLQNAIDAQVDVQIIYNGGSQPGAIRAIHPIKFRGEALIARDLISGKAKSYMLSKISLPKLFKEYEQKKEEKPFPKIEDPEIGFPIIMDSCNQAFEIMGWKKWKYFKEERFIGLYKVRKNGVPLKYPEVAISFDDNIGYMPTDPNMNLKRQRPWVVSAKGENTLTYSHFEKALERFMEYAQKAALRLNLK